MKLETLLLEKEPSLFEIEKQYLECLLKKYEHNRVKIGLVLGIPHNSVYAKLKKHGLETGPKRQGYRSDLQRSKE
jgi:transcriptional regulator with PAS, ATPase and Fis domain